MRTQEEVIEMLKPMFEEILELAIEEVAYDIVTAENPELELANMQAEFADMKCQALKNKAEREQPQEPANA